MPLELSGRIKLTLAYDGTAYCGWQLQKQGEKTIQGELEAVFSRIFSTPVIVHGAGRTDSGVHARSQVAHVDLPRPDPTGRLRDALNGLLPSDIYVRQVEAVPETFHARKSALWKRYVYVVATGERPLPFIRPYVWHCVPPLDLERVRRAAALLVGTHDFKCFQGAKSDVLETVRTITRIDVGAPGEPVYGFLGSDRDGCHLIRFTFEGNGFLKQMVRNMMGTLIAIGTGRRPVDDIPRLIASRDRTLAAATAPAQGLFLDEIFY